MELLVFFGVVLLIITLLLLRKHTGLLDKGVYPDNSTSKYLLPWEAGIGRRCVLSNRGLVSHWGPKKQFAWDFYMPIGTKILASRGGIVESVVVSHSRKGLNRKRCPNNEIFIRHEDGTKARYTHIKKSGSRVVVGQSVLQGEFIAESGDVGRSLGPHLHFEIQNQNGITLPISFKDIQLHFGVPKMFFSYTSKNQLALSTNGRSF